MIGAETAASLAPILASLPARRGLAVVVHGPADAATLAATSPFPITEARGRVRLEPDRVYTIPPACDGTFQRGELVVVEGAGPRAPVDRLLRSLAEEHGAHGTGVFLNGRGNDGVIGIRRLKEAGGLTIAETPDDRATVLVRSVITSGVVDLILPLAAIGPRLAVLLRPPRSELDDEHEAGGDTGSRPAGEAADTLHALLSLVRIRTGHDFSSYKRATLYRRVARRVQVTQSESLASYLLYAREHPDELTHLLRDFLISVTNFFRDRESFEALRSQVIPRLFAGKSATDHVRAWVAGCASGEEAYSIAMLLCEHASTLQAPPRIQVFATDIDEDALGEARAGRYPSTIGVDVAPDRLQRFFTVEGDHVKVTKELRELVLFSPHNVLRDPPFSRLDLISCRNLMIYLNRDGQDRALNAFHFGLRADGFLFLGSSESAENTTLFAGVDVKHRVFARRSVGTRPLGEALPGVTRWDPPPAPVARPATAERPTTGQLHHQLVERYAPPSILLDENLDIVHVSEHAGRWLQLPGGEPTRQVLRLIHPALRLELRTAIYAARQSGRRSDTRIVRFEEAGQVFAIELRVRAVDPSELGEGALLVMFDELDPAAGVHPAGPAAGAALEPVMRELEDELRRNRDQLRTTIEQYETSVEELKASNEELHAINEELRSATEEIETSKEELQSVNEELSTLNQELSLKVDEISHANSDLQNLMTSTEIGVVFLDRELNIKRFTPRAQELFNVIPSDLGRPLAHLTHRLETDELPQLARSVIQNLRTIERELRGRDGRRYLTRLLPYRSLEDRISGVVMTFVDVSDLRDALDARQRTEAALHTSEARLRFALRTTPMLVLALDAELRVTWGYVMGTQVPAIGEDASIEAIAWLAPEHRRRLAEIARQVIDDEQGAGGHVVLDVLLDGVRRTFDFRIERAERGVSVVGFDVSASKHAEAALREVDHRKDEFLATLSHELRNPLTPLRVALDVARLAGNDPAQLAQAHGIMERQVHHLTHLVDELLDLSRITQGKIEIERAVVDPVRVVEAALEATQPLLRQRDHRLTVSLPEIACRVVGDYGRLTQVLTNLLNNAVKHTPPGGEITVALSVDLPRALVVLRVSDTGQGIAPELLPRIFEIFIQGRDDEGRAHAGLGIGLNLASRVVELHGGRIAAASPGRHLGSTLTVELPLAASGRAATGSAS